MAKRLPTDAEILAQLPAATAAADAQPRARTARYDRETRRIVIELTNGCLFAFPAHVGQGLQDATDDQLAAVEVLPGGSGLVWEELNVDLWVPGLLAGVFGTKAWMRELGRLGGQVQSEAKAAASRENGKKGGRPRKVRPEPTPPSAGGTKRPESRRVG
ncbi:MAG TPA: DUF2442 domain-containing protein [Longimicrobium sp.]|nr:DUF2442 domain-containing protein [Longimicrobium sp.]